MTWEKIGEVGVDSGQLLVCDPSYIDSHWQDKEFLDVRRYKDKTTGKVYQFLKDFPNFEAHIDDYSGRSPNQLLQEGVWERLEEPNDSSFSYAGCSSQTLSTAKAGQLVYALGHAGIGVAFRSGYGDGHYPVIARKNKDGRIVEVRIIMGDPEEDA